MAWFKQVFPETMIIVLVLSRAIKYHVYSKRQKWICATFSFILLVVTVHYNYTKISKFTPILSIRIVLSFFYSLLSHFENVSTWISRLPFAVNAMLNLSPEASLCRREAGQREKSKRAGDNGNINATQREPLWGREVLSKQVINQ